jgi:hypothetical protein
MPDCSTATARWGAGSKLWRYDEDASTWEEIAYISDLGIPSPEVGSIETTYHGSGGTKTFIPGETDPGTIDVSMNWNPTETSHNIIYADRDAKQVKKYKVEVVDGSSGDVLETYDFCGFVTQISPEVPLDDRITATVTIQLTGEVARR